MHVGSLSGEGRQTLSGLFTMLFVDGIFREGPQIATTPGLVKMFCRCHDCQRVWPHWRANVTAEEFKAQKRRTLGCKCGAIRLVPTMLPAWQSVWWFCVRGWLIRKVILRHRVWDPRIPVMEKDRT